MGDNFIAVAFLVTIFTLGILFYFVKTTEEDIAKCVAATNYTAERCEWEMTR